MKALAQKALRFCNRKASDKVLKNPSEITAAGVVAKNTTNRKSGRVADCISDAREMPAQQLDDVEASVVIDEGQHSAGGIQNNDSSEDFHSQFSITFQNGDVEEIAAFNIEQAAILASAARIASGKSLQGFEHRVKAVAILDGPYGSPASSPALYLSKTVAEAEAAACERIRPILPLDPLRLTGAPFIFLLLVAYIAGERLKNTFRPRSIERP